MIFDSKPIAKIQLVKREMITIGGIPIDISMPETNMKNDDWIPACNGTEVPFTSRTGMRLLYCWQPSTGKHAYLNLDTDIILTDEEASAALATS
jgi:hypothetical protein